MLSYGDALTRILEAAGGPLAAEPVPVEEALGRALAEDVVAPADLPPFDNSAVDGYAISGTEPRGKNAPGVFRVAFTVPAGGAPPGPLSPGWTARIFTGAPLPEGADRVVMQEDAEPLDFDEVFLKSPGSAGDFIRRRGADVARGEVALAKGAGLGPGEIGLLAALNVTGALCPRLPYVGLLTTGNEVVPPGKGGLRPGQIRDANGPALSAAVAEAGGVVAGRRHARDTEADVRSALEAFAGCDVIVASGGVSVGDHDHVRTVLERTGNLDFWRIAIKPGKPLAFGRVHDALFFGLPGNPVSSLVTFELFVRPVLRRLAGHANADRPRVSAVLDAPLSHTPGRREFARARLSWRDGTYHATPTGHQGSHRLLSLAGAEALLVAHEDRGDYVAGETLPALLLA